MTPRQTGFLTIQQAVQQGTELLLNGGIGVPRLTAEVLLAFALQQERVYLFSHALDPLTELAWIHYGRYLHQRMQGVPTQYITGRQEFYGRSFLVSPEVLIPRPETEHLVEAAIPLCGIGTRVADIGCGSGTIAVTLALETQAIVMAADIASGPLRVTSLNARRLQADVSLAQCDLTAAFGEASLDVLVSNPPYIAYADRDSLAVEVRGHEPALALYGGMDGYGFYRRLAVEAKRVLRPGGWLLLEVGQGQAEAVQDMLQEGWEPGEALPDLAGIPRVVRARRQA